MEMKPGYKQTEVGVIPEDWEVKPLVALAKIRSGIAKNSNKTVNSPVFVHYLRVANVQDGYLDLSEMSEIRVNRDDVTRYAVLPGDVLMNEGGDLDKLGRGAMWHGEFSPCVHQNHVFVVRCGSSLSPDYLNVWTGAAPARLYFLVAGKQTTNLASINKTALGQLPVALPCVAEQAAIAEALSDTDSLVESLELLIAKKTHLKQGALQELLFPKAEWLEKKLGSTATLKARIGWQGLTTAEYLETGDYFLVTGTDFKSGYIDWNHCPYVEESRYKQDNNIQLRPHDVLVTKDGTIGKVALIKHLEKPATLNSGVFVIRPIEDAFHPDFFYYLLCSNVFSTFLAQLSAGSTINHLYQKDFVNFIYKTPATIAEQTAIATILSDMDAEIAALNENLTKTKKIKQGMMQELLTGRIRLVSPTVKVIPFPRKKKPATVTNTHNWEINEAVIIGVLAKNFGSEKYPLARKRCTKLTYLLHRHAEGKAEGYLKKAAGPYNPRTRYSGPEKIAQKNHYVRACHNGTYEGFVATDNVVKAEAYFQQWYGSDALAWLERFRYHKTDELELLATVDMAMEELKGHSRPTTLETVKRVIHDHPEWNAKLDRETFSDDNIERAIQTCRELFI